MKRLCKYLVLSLLVTIPVCASAQRRISADVEVKQVSQGKSVTITKSVYCANNGRLVVHFHKPEDYYMLTNVKGETRLYMPKTNEVLSENSGSFSSKDELLSLFMAGRVQDLGLSLYGYQLQSTVNEDGKIKKTFVNRNDRNTPKVEIVFDNYLPIFIAYYDKNGKVSSKTYFSNYTSAGRIKFPARSTSIAYVAKDSTVTRTVYSNVKVDSEESEFNFEIPSDAKTVALPNAVKGAANKEKK